MARLAGDLIARAAGRPRYLVAIAGAPGSGKSRLAEALSAEIETRAPGRVAILPMDGYHLDNAVLQARGLLAVKGAPETFDVWGLIRDLERVRAGTREVVAPVFDRELDLARAGARVIRPEQSIVLVEGNYLLLRAAPWDAAAPMFDRTLFVEAPESELRRRLVRRWLRYGLAAEAATRRAEENDLCNARLVAAGSRPADIVWQAGLA